MLFGKRKGGGMVSFEGEPLISAVEARKVPSSLTGTACGCLRSLLAREGPLPQTPLPQRALFEVPEDAPHRERPLGLRDSHKVERADDAVLSLSVPESSMSVHDGFIG